jgi:hypothetical protein
MRLQIAAQLIFQVLGQCQVLIVPTQDEMIANGDAVKLDLVPFSVADADQGKIRRAAADIADQDLLPRLDTLLPVLVVSLSSQA